MCAALIAVAHLAISRSTLLAQVLRGPALRRRHSRPDVRQASAAPASRWRRPRHRAGRARDSAQMAPPTPVTSPRTTGRTGLPIIAMIPCDWRHGAQNAVARNATEPGIKEDQAHEEQA